MYSIIFEKPVNEINLHLISAVNLWLANMDAGKLNGSVFKQGSFLHEHARPLNKRCAWRLTTGFAFFKMARLKAIIAIILLVGLGEFARDLTKCVVCKKKTLTWS